MSRQLSLNERIFIERSLNRDYTFAYIAEKLNRSASTISREVKRYRFFVDKFPAPDSNDCVKRLTCIRNNLCDDVPVHGCYFYRCKSCPDHKCYDFCPAYVSMYCSQLDKPPYVCTGCPKIKKCKRNHAYYTAHRADAAHKKTIREAHRGIRKSPDELKRIGEIIEPLIKRGQSLNHICATHSHELGISERTLYNYIDSSVFAVRNLDLPKKVAYRKRRQPKVLTRMEYQYRKGRTINDFNSFIETNPDLSVVEMDTVKGKREKSKILLTMIFRKSSFMMIFLMPDGTQKSVLSVFNSLYDMLGSEYFKKLFPVILTDNGVEFKDPLHIEFDEYRYPRTRLFYCDPQASWQKPHVENNHKFIRRILPKGTSFKDLTKEDIRLITCHINSVKREQLDNMSPFDLMVSKEEKKLLSLLDLSPIPPDEVLLKPALLKR